LRRFIADIEAFAAHLLSLERRRREIYTAEEISRREKKRDDGPSAKRRRHVEAVPLVTSTPMNGKDIQVQLPDLSLGGGYHDSEDGDVAITGISADFDSTGASSFCVNDVICEVKNDSVIMKGDADKYRNSDEPDSESSCSSDSDEMTWRGALPLQEALIELNEDPPEDSGSDSSDIEDLGLVMQEREDGTNGGCCVATPPC